MDNNLVKRWTSYLAYALLLLSPQLETKTILFSSKGNGFPKCEDPVSVTRNGPRVTNVVSRLSLKSNIGISLPLLLHSRISERIETATCKISLNLETAEKNHSLKLESLWLSRHRYQNIEGAQCNITLNIDITSNEKNQYKGHGHGKKLPLQDFPGSVKVTIPELEIPTINYTEEHFAFLFAAYELRNYKNECSLQFQEFGLTKLENETPFAIQINSMMCKSRKCSHTTTFTGKPRARAMTKVFISCLVFFAAILFTGCFVMICTCSSLMKLCGNGTGQTVVNSNNDHY